MACSGAHLTDLFVSFLRFRLLMSLIPLLAYWMSCIMTISTSKQFPSLLHHIISCFCTFAVTHQGPNEKRLLYDIFNRDLYNRLERPALNESSPLRVDFGLTLQQIIDVVMFYIFLFCQILSFSAVTLPKCNSNCSICYPWRPRDCFKLLGIFTRTEKSATRINHIKCLFVQWAMYRNMHVRSSWQILQNTISALRSRSYHQDLKINNYDLNSRSCC